MQTLESGETSARPWSPPPFIFGIPILAASLLGQWLRRRSSLGAVTEILTVGVFAGLVGLLTLWVARRIGRDRAWKPRSFSSSMLQLVAMSAVTTFANFAVNELFPW